MTTRKEQYALRWENRRRRETERAELGLDWPDYLIHMAHEWERTYGRQVAAYEWNLPFVRLRTLKRSEGGTGSGSFSAETVAFVEKAHEDRLWPTASTVLKHFGSWNAFMEKCGYAPVGVGQLRP